MKKSIQAPADLFRSGTFEHDKENGLLRMSISSTAPYKRYDWMNDEEYYEVLRHDPEGIDDTRLQAGTSLLFNHDRDILLGRNVSFTCDGEKCYVESKISMAPDVESYRIKIDEGILKATSVGYQIIGDGELMGAKDGLPIYGFRWQPYEASLVTIEADINVGIGRQRGEKDEQRLREITIKIEENGSSVQKDSAQAGNSDTTEPKNSMKRKHKYEADNGANATTGSGGASVDVVKERQGAVAEYKSRCEKIDGFCAGLKNPQWREAAEAIAKKHKGGEEPNFDAFRAEALNSFDGIVKIDAADPNTGLSKKEAGQFSMLRAARQIASGQGLSGFEKEASEATAKKLKRTASADGTIFLPNEVAEMDLMRHFERQLTRAQNTTSFTAGGATTQNQYGPLIEILNNAMVLGRLGITQMSGIVGDLIFPQQTGGATAYWVSETGALTDSQATFAQKAMTPHRCGATVPFTTQFLAQSSLSAEAFLRNELMTRLAILKDLAGLEGTGANGQPLGVKNTVGINATVTFASQAYWADVVEFETGIVDDNADLGSMGFALSVATVGRWKTILKDSVAGAGYLISDTMTANGYPVQRTKQITGNIAFFGVWKELINASWAGMEFVVDPYALKKSGQIEITVNELTDFLTRQPLSFNVSTDSAAQ